MAKQDTVKMPLEYVKKTLCYFGLEYTSSKLPDGNGIQLNLTSKNFSHININSYKTGAVIVQPYENLISKFLTGMLELRAKKLRTKGKI